MDADLYTLEAAQNPWPALLDIREAGPIVYNNVLRSWLVNTDKLCRRAFTLPERLSHEGGLGQEIFGQESFLVIDDKKRHDELRAIWQTAFHRGNIEAIRPVVRKIANEMLDAVEERLRDGEQVDAEKALCRHLPAYVIAHMLGVPEESRPDIVRWSDDLAAAVSLPHTESRETHPLWVTARRSREELGLFLADQIRYRRDHPGDDLISQIVHSDLGKTLPEPVVVANSRQLLFAGNETTAKWLGNSLVVLNDFPEVRDEILKDRSLLPNALEEVMRWQPVVMSSPRFVRGGNVEIGGVDVPDNANVSIMICLGNRDPERYENPDEFNIHRPYFANLGFGFGMHNCLGVTLARVEAQEVISCVLDRIPDYRVSGKVVYGSFQLRGPSELPLSLH